MILIKLSIKRYQEKTKNENDNFNINIASKKFTYLITNIEKKESIEKWKNNFYAAYDFKKDNKKNFVLISIEGISLFDKNWKHRRDIKTPRNEDLYHYIERLVKKTIKIS